MLCEKNHRYNTTTPEFEDKTPPSARKPAQQNAPTPQKTNIDTTNNGPWKMYLLFKHGSSFWVAIP